MGGDIQSVLKPRDEAERRRAVAMGIPNPDAILRINDLAGGDVIFAATAVTDGFLLRGVRFTRVDARIHSVVMRSRSGAVRFIEATHRLDIKPENDLAACPAGDLGPLSIAMEA